MWAFIRHLILQLLQKKLFRVAHHPWNGPLVLTDRLCVPCLYDVLADGAPNLEKINEHYSRGSLFLTPDWSKLNQTFSCDTVK